MKIAKICVYLIIITGILLFLTISCKKGDNGESNNVTDIDGNIYHTVTIGRQVWMKENLKTAKFSDGTTIPNVTSNSNWVGLTTPAYCWYDNDSGTYKAKYGALYDWHAVNKGNLCPEGWHVASDAEWDSLITYLKDNGYGYEGSGIDIAKSMAAKTDWNPFSQAGSVGNDAATNDSSGFTAFPRGFRNFDGGFYGIGYYSYWWSSTESDKYHGSSRYLYSHYSTINNFAGHKEVGYSIRCLKNN